MHDLAWPGLRKGDTVRGVFAILPSFNDVGHAINSVLERPAFIVVIPVAVLETLLNYYRGLSG